MRLQVTWNNYARREGYRGPLHEDLVEKTKSLSRQTSEDSSGSHSSLERGREYWYACQQSLTSVKVLQKFPCGSQDQVRSNANSHIRATSTLPFCVSCNEASSFHIIRLSKDLCSIQACSFCSSRWWYDCTYRFLLASIDWETDRYTSEVPTFRYTLSVCVRVCLSAFYNK